MAAAIASDDTTRMEAAEFDDEALLIKSESAEQPTDRGCRRPGFVKVLVSAVLLFTSVLWLTLQSPVLGFYTNITTVSSHPIFDALVHLVGPTSRNVSAIDHNLSLASKTHASWATSSVNGVPMIIDDQRTMWTAGWHARNPEYFLQAPPVVSWTPEAISILRNEFNRIQFPADCHQVKG